MRHLPVTLVLVAALSLAAPFAVAANDLDQAEERVERLTEQLGTTTEAYELAWAELETVRTEIEDLEHRAEELRTEAVDIDRRLGDRARAMFMHGATVQLQTLLSAEETETALARAGMVSTLQRRETASLEEAVAIRTSLGQTEQLLAERSERLDQLQAALEESAAQLQDDLGSAQETAHELRTREERRRTIERGAQQGTYACIFEAGAHRFRDSWGEPRSGGRSHRGTDVFARMDEPVYAFTDGVIHRRSSSPLGGLGLYLRGDDGNIYYYAHLNSVAARGAVGTRVEAGEHIAYNGATGNASPSAPHVHFEIHPGGGAAVNPYPWLAAACH
jgi:peptidoglycan LD-endopeptidase LytH